MRFFYMTVVVPATVLIPLVMALLYYRHLRTAEKIMAFFLLVTGIFNAIGSWMAWHSQSNLFLLPVYTCIEFLFICFFFREILTESRLKKWLPFIAVILLAATIANSVFLQHTNKFNTYARSVSAILTIAFCLYYYKSNLAKTGSIPWKNEPVFWFVTGFLVYFSSSLFLFILSNFTLVMKRPLALTLWNFHATMALIMYLLFTAGFWYAKRKR